MEKERKYLLFAGEVYYPSGGASDFIDSYATIEEAQSRGEQKEWAEIAVLKDDKLVAIRHWWYRDGPDSRGAWRDGDAL